VPYHCVVCVKQVPDTKNVGTEAMKADGTVNRAALPAIFNPEDLNALETALKIKADHGGAVTVITMGLPKAADVLRESLYRGADRAVLITDRRAAGSDTLATGYILATAIARLKPDLVLCGRQAIDGDTAQVGPQIAEQLDCTLITYLEELVKLAGPVIRVRRNIGRGYEVVEGHLPALITVTGTANAPRPPAIKRMLKYKRAQVRAEIEAGVKNLMRDADDDARTAETDKRCADLADRGLLIDQWNLDDIEADLDRCGLAGSPTKVHRVQSIVLTGGEYKAFDPTEAGVAKLVHELIEDHTIG
jgi:electron transfer flavoprotein beta subunit